MLGIGGVCRSDPSQVEAEALEANRDLGLAVLEKPGNQAKTMNSTEGSEEPWKSLIQGSGSA